MIILDIGDVWKESITESNLNLWLEHINAAYLAYYDLVGKKPATSEGETIKILKSDETWGAAWVYGTSDNINIYWQEKCIGGALKKINDTGSWDFGILHEIGHLFDLAEGRWNFHAELMANYKMLYVLETLSVHEPSADYVKNKFKEDYKTNTLFYQNGVINHDALTHFLFNIKDMTGWEPIKKTFRFFNQMEVYPKTPLEKFKLFLDKQTEFSGVDVRGVFIPGELDAVYNYFANKS